jgi:HAUS augmin-like complex subunit 6 N-terminus
MSSSSSIPSLAPPRSLRSSTGKMSSPAGPSHIRLFLTNLRLLDLDLRDDWPGITAGTFSTKDTQQSQKKRIQCVEWALYHLFSLWDPEGSRNVLPSLPPPHPTLVLCPG